MVLTKAEKTMPEYEASFLIKCANEVEEFFEEDIPELWAYLLKDEQYKAQERLLEAYLAGIEKMTKVRRYNRRKRYCINIKVHSLSLSSEEQSYLYENWEESMDKIWNFYIMPWIKQREGPEIYQAGRSGGWLYIDTDVVEWNEGDTYPPELHIVRGKFKDVRDFKEGWESTLEEIRGYIQGEIENSK